MKNIKKLFGIILLTIIILILAIGIGSVKISPLDTLRVILSKIFPFDFSLNPTTESILFKIRIPRVIMAFISGGGLAISGVTIQSILRNHLASPYTVGVSSGAALGASTAIFFKISIFGFLTLPIFGLIFGLFTVFLALGIASKVDKTLQNNSIILTGMVLSLFASSIITIIMAISNEQLQSLVFWQMGSFSGKNWKYPLTLFPIVLICFFILLGLSRELDIMTLGEEQAQTSGVEIKKTKLTLISLATILTGAIISMSGIIGFIDLFTPHIARKIFGSTHKYVLPASAILGGLFMVLCDLVARTIASPIELPVGAITSFIGAPFFIYLYFSKRK